MENSGIRWFSGIIGLVWIILIVTGCGPSKSNLYEDDAWRRYKSKMDSIELIKDTIL